MLPDDIAYGHRTVGAYIAEFIRSTESRLTQLLYEVDDLKEKVEALERENEALKGELAALNPVDQELAGQGEPITMITDWRGFRAS